MVLTSHHPTHAAADDHRHRRDRGRLRRDGDGRIRLDDTRPAPSDPRGWPFHALDEKIRAGMARYAIPGVALGMLYRGREYVRGYGVTNVDYPLPVDGDTVFRIASNTKTFTGTTVMQLVEQELLDLDAPVRSYLPDFRVSDPAASARVTVRQLLNHSAGWLGDFFIDTTPRCRWPVASSRSRPVRPTAQDAPPYQTHHGPRY